MHNHVSIQILTDYSLFTSYTLNYGEKYWEYIKYYI